MLHLAIIITLLLFVVIVMLVGTLIFRRVLIGQEEARQHALYAELRPLVVGWLGEPDRLPPEGLIGSMDRRRRDVVARLLARYGTMLRGESRQRIIDYVADQGFVEALVQDLRSWRSWRRGRAARALGDFGSARAVRHLSGLVVGDRDPSVRLAATRALGRIDDYKSAAALLIALPTNRVPAGVVAQSLLDLGPHAFRALVSACSDEDVVARRTACRLVGLAGTGSSPDGMRAARTVLQARALDDRDAEVRAAALRALALLGDTTSEDVVRSALTAEDPAVRHAGADAARALYLRALAPDLIDALARELATDRPHWRLVRSAAHAWAQLAEDLDPRSVPEPVRDRALPFLREAAAGADRELRT
ncbi:MAG: lyase domain protein repeat-containing protein [Thermoleophilia bacterium]|nr:lyase domain protein repeat-containing protein [Thermoleophilia bacterium]